MWGSRGARGRPSRMPAVVAVALVLGVTMATGIAAQGAGERAMSGRTDGWSKPVLFLHGLDAFNGYTPRAGADYETGWEQDMGRHWRNWAEADGFPGAPLEYWSYYECDKPRAGDPSRFVDDHGAHGSYDPSNHAVHNGAQGEAANHQGGFFCEDLHDLRSGSEFHDASTTIEHIAYHFAWSVYRKHTLEGRCVDAVAHSMGGIILRHAIQGVARGDPDFPPELCIEDVVTLETPHGGADSAETCVTYQCYELRIGSPMMRGLGAAPDLRDLSGHRIRWTAIGSYDDVFVNGFSAMQVAADLKIVYSNAAKSGCELSNLGVGHLDINVFASDCRNSVVTYQLEGEPARLTRTAPGPARAAYEALTRPDLRWISASPEGDAADRGPRIEEAEVDATCEVDCRPGETRVKVGRSIAFTVECSDDPDTPDATDFSSARFEQERFAVLSLDGAVVEIDEASLGDDLDVSVRFDHLGYHTVAARCTDALVAGGPDKEWRVNVTERDPGDPPTPEMLARHTMAPWIGTLETDSFLGAPPGGWGNTTVRSAGGIEVPMIDCDGLAAETGNVTVEPSFTPWFADIGLVAACGTLSALIFLPEPVMGNAWYRGVEARYEVPECMHPVIDTSAQSVRAFGLFSRSRGVAEIHLKNDTWIAGPWSNDSWSYPMTMTATDGCYIAPTAPTRIFDPALVSQLAVEHILTDPRDEAEFLGTRGPIVSANLTGYRLEFDRHGNASRHYVGTSDSYARYRFDVAMVCPSSPIESVVAWDEAGRGTHVTLPNASRLPIYLDVPAGYARADVTFADGHVLHLHDANADALVSRLACDAREGFRVDLTYPEGNASTELLNFHAHLPGAWNATPGDVVRPAPPTPTPEVTPKLPPNPAPTAAPTSGPGPVSPSGTPAGPTKPTNEASIPGPSSALVLAVALAFGLAVARVRTSRR